MDSLAREQLNDGWRPNSVVKALPLSKKYTFELSSRLFLNVVDPERVNKLLEPFTLMTQGKLSVPTNLPGTAYNRAIKGGKMMHAEMMRIVKERRKEVAENKESEARDLLSKMLLLTDDDGKYVCDGKIASFFVGMLVASHDTTSSSLIAVINFLAQLPHIYKVFKEQMEIAKSRSPNELLTWEDVEDEVLMERSKSLPLHKDRSGKLKLKSLMQVSPFLKDGRYFGRSIHPTITPTTSQSRRNLIRRGLMGADLHLTRTFRLEEGQECAPEKTAKRAILVLLHNLVTRFRLEN